MLNFPKSLLIIPLILLTQSCRESTDEASRSVLSGEWVSACFANTAAHPSTRVSYLFDDDHGVVRTQELFLDQNCSNLAGRLIHRGDVALEVREEISVFNVDLFFDSVNLEAASAEAIALWNQSSFCGRNDWVLGSSQDLTGTEETGCLTYGNAKVEYRDLVEVDGEKEIIFGASLSPLVPRPSVVEPGHLDRVFRAKGL